MYITDEEPPALLSYRAAPEAAAESALMTKAITAGRKSLSSRGRGLYACYLRDEV
jgi:hypothetical protein